MKPTVWVTDLVQVPELTVPGVDIEGVLFVLEPTTDTLVATEMVERGHALHELFQAVCETTGRVPTSIQCRSSVRLRLQLAARALGCSFESDTDVRALDPAVRGLRRHLDGESQPLVPDPELPWDIVLKTLWETQPWSRFSSHLSFTFTRADERLEGWSFLLYADPEASHGFVLIPPAAHRNVARRNLLEPSANPSPALSFRFDPVDNVSASTLGHATSHGYVQGGHAPLVCQVEGDAVQPANRDQQQVVLAVLEAATAAVHEMPRHIPADGVSTAGTGILGSYELTVLVDPEPERPWCSYPYQLLTWTEMKSRWVFVVKSSKKDAERFARHLEGVEALFIERTSDSMLVFDDAGVLLFTALDVPSAWAQGEPSDVRIIAMRGGAVRPTWREQDAVASPLFETEVVDRA